MDPIDHVSESLADPDRREPLVHRADGRESLLYQLGIADDVRGRAGPAAAEQVDEQIMSLEAALGIGA